MMPVATTGRAWSPPGWHSGHASPHAPHNLFTALYRQNRHASAVAAAHTVPGSRLKLASAACRVRTLAGTQTCHALAITRPVPRHRGCIADDAAVCLDMVNVVATAKAHIQATVRALAHASGGWSMRLVGWRRPIRAYQFEFGLMHLRFLCDISVAPASGTSRSRANP